MSTQNQFFNTKGFKRRSKPLNDNTMFLGGIAIGMCISLVVFGATYLLLVKF
jgi:hypothetical protein